MPAEATLDRWARLASPLRLAFVAGAALLLAIGSGLLQTPLDALVPGGRPHARALGYSAGELGFWLAAMRRTGLGWLAFAGVGLELLTVLFASVALFLLAALLSGDAPIRTRTRTVVLVLPLVVAMVAIVEAGLLTGAIGGLPVADVAPWASGLRHGLFAASAGTSLMLGLARLAGLRGPPQD